MMKNANSQFIKKHFHLSIIEENASGGSYFLVPHVTKKSFVQVISLMKKEDDFVNVQIYLSNLVATELWAEIDVGAEFVPLFLKEMMAIVQTESTKKLSTDAQFESTILNLEKAETRQSLLIEHLEELKIQMNSKKTPADMKAKLEAKYTKVEEGCIKEEIEISRLTHRYLSNTLDEMDPFFFSKLATLDWSQKKKAKKK